MNWEIQFSKHKWKTEAFEDCWHARARGTTATPQKDAGELYLSLVTSSDLFYYFLGLLYVCSVVYLMYIYIYIENMYIVT